MPLTQLNGPIIAAGQSLSGGLDCTAGSIIRVYTPAAWDAANISFQLSFDGVSYFDLITKGGAEVVTALKPNSVIIMDEYGQQTAFIKIRSGTSARPVIQTAQRTFAVTIQK